MNYGVRKRGIIEYGVKTHQICIFYIDIDERVCDGFKYPTKNLFLIDDLVQTWYKLSKSVVGIGVVERQTTEQQSPLLVELVDH